MTQRSIVLPPTLAHLILSPDPPPDQFDIRLPRQRNYSRPYQSRLIYMPHPPAPFPRRRVRGPYYCRICLAYLYFSSGNSTDEPGIGQAFLSSSEDVRAVSLQPRNEFAKSRRCRLHVDERRVAVSAGQTPIRRSPDDQSPYYSTLSLTLYRAEFPLRLAKGCSSAFVADAAFVGGPQATASIGLAPCATVPTSAALATTAALRRSGLTALALVSFQASPISSFSSSYLY